MELEWGGIDRGSGELGGWFGLAFLGIGCGSENSLKRVTWWPVRLALLWGRGSMRRRREMRVSRQNYNTFCNLSNRQLGFYFWICDTFYRSLFSPLSGILPRCRVLVTPGFDKGVRGELLANGSSGWMQRCSIWLE